MGEITGRQGRRKGLNKLSEHSEVYTHIYDVGVAFTGTLALKKRKRRYDFLGLLAGHGQQMIRHGDDRNLNSTQAAGCRSCAAGCKMRDIVSSCQVELEQPG